MLDIVRNLVSSIFGKILLGLMVLSFALWGVGDILTSGNSKLAAKVGSQKVTLEELKTILKELGFYDESIYILLMGILDAQLASCAKI